MKNYPLWLLCEASHNNQTAIARMLNTQLGEGGYDEILAEAGAESAAREDKIAVLNSALREITDTVASVGEGLGVGYYSRELDAILTYGPSAEFQENVGRSIGADHPGREVMATNTPMVQMGTMVRGNIMNAMVPVERGGTVIGYIWANELISELEGMLNRSNGLITALLLSAFLLMGAIVILFFRRLMRTEQRSRDTVEEASREIRRVDGLMHVVNRAVSSLLSADEDSFEQALDNSMRMMATAFDVDRLFIWKGEAVEGGVRFRLEACFQEEEGRSHRYIDFAEGVFPPAAGWEAWLGSLQSNQSVTRSRSAMQAAGSRWLESYGIESITTVPVMLQDDFWGFVSFSNCHKERAFTKDEEAILFSGSLLMANAIARNEMLQRLMLAREEALAGTRAKSAFLASMSHEMRTPMNAIIGMAAIGKSAADPERKDYAFGRIEDASIHLLGIINDVLDISKIESGKLESSPVEFVFEEMLQRVVNVTDERMADKEHAFLVRIDDAIPASLVCDDQRLAQVITNLLSNAIKFTPRLGSIQLDIRLLGQEDGLCTLQFDVTDTGIGLSEAQQKRIFNSFEQAETSTTRKYGGTGLGLSICKNLVALMGGEIWVQSEEGKGSTFSFTIRAPQGHAGPAPELPAGLPWPQLRFLMVDGGPAVRENCAHVMRRLGLRCDTAAGAEEALALIEKNGRYDLCLVDLQLPDMEGMALTRRIKAADATQKVILLASALSWDALLQAARQAGVDSFLAKPLLPTALVTGICECMTGRRLARDGRALERKAADNHTGRRILLAEDIDINGEIFITLLEPTGLEIAWAKNGAEAVRMFVDAAGQYDMIFMDVQMPEMDGHAATRAIRALDLPAAKTVPIVAMTANVFKEDVDASRDAGMNGHLGKPLNIEEVLRILRQYLPPNPGPC